MLFSFQIYVTFTDMFVILTSNLISLWSEILYSRMWIPFNSLRLILWLKIWSIMVNTTNGLTKTYCFSFLVFVFYKANYFKLFDSVIEVYYIFISCQFPLNYWKKLLREATCYCRFLNFYVSLSSSINFFLYTLWNLLIST